MKASLSWLRRYVDIEEDAPTLARDLTMFGVNIEEVHTLGAAFRGVVYGRVLETEKHPRADRLTICRVDTGGARPLQIVCGAQNVRPGLGVPVALDGAVLAGGLTIKRSKLRGEVSEGMICSAAELGLGEDEAGIMELDFSERPGASLEGRLGEVDVVLIAEITPNRPDLLCHLGIAREIAAMYRRPLRRPDVVPLADGEDFDLRIEDGSDCPRYSAAFIDDVAVGPSPAWLETHLKAAGFKPINNIVDVTNFVLLELGQPLHAFDRDTLGKDAIVVRRARSGERLVTLDGVERDLDDALLVIADADRPVALAGVMGGRESEVRDGTRRILLESAMFDPRLVRRARQRLKLETEASYRFEREGDVGITRLALERACHLIEEIGAGKSRPLVAERLHDRLAIEPRAVSMRIRQVNRVMGTKLAGDDIVALLDRLEFKAKTAGEIVHVLVPTFRRDIRGEIDLIEEAARVYGYESIGRDEESRSVVFSAVSHADLLRERIADHLASRGFAEAVTTSFMDPAEPLGFGWGPADERGTFLRIANPLSEGQGALRTSLLPGLLAVVRRNTPAEQEEIRIFEIGKVFMPVPGAQGLPREEVHLAAMLARRAGPLQWIEPPRPVDFFDLKGECEAALEFLGLSGARMERLEGAPGKLFAWSIDGKRVAEGGVLAKGTSDRYEIDAPVYYFDILMDSVPAAPGGWERFAGVSPYPAVKRDLCIVVGGRTTFADVLATIERQGKYLESIRLFDYYRGGHLGEGRRSYTFRLAFRSSEGTLDSAAADREVQRILAALQREHQATLRTE